MLYSAARRGSALGAVAPAQYEIAGNTNQTCHSEGNTRHLWGASSMMISVVILLVVSTQTLGG
jgi:hypothetical protein